MVSSFVSHASRARGLPGSGTAKDKAHLARLQTTVELVEDVDRRQFERAGLGDLEEFDERPQDRLLDRIGESSDVHLIGREREVRTTVAETPLRRHSHLHAAGSGDVQLVPRDADYFALEAGSVVLRLLVAQVGEQVEVLGRVVAFGFEILFAIVTPEVR